MRLLQLQLPDKLSLTTVREDAAPPYAILSRTWDDVYEEITFEDVTTQTNLTKRGRRKLLFCGKQALADGLEYFWIDTCCINRNSEAEVSESINSMFRFYQNSQQCYVYLSDVFTNVEEDTSLSAADPRYGDAIRNSRWFTRGWTLQEMLAPKSLEFFSESGCSLGTKHTLKHTIHEATGIPLNVITGADLRNVDVAEKLSGRPLAKKTGHILLSASSM